MRLVRSLRLPEMNNNISHDPTTWVIFSVTPHQIILAKSRRVYFHFPFKKTKCGGWLAKAAFNLYIYLMPHISISQNFERIDGLR